MTTDLGTLALEDRGAEISDDGVFRYLLWRRWNRLGPRALFIMLNPSTADANVDDPTIRRCMGFARKWNMGGIRVVNLYPFRAADPADLLKAKEPLGHGNLNFIERSVDRNGIAIAAWGSHRLARGHQAQKIKTLFYDLDIPLYALRLTAGGDPGHPLYIPANTVPIVFEPARHDLKVGDAWRGMIS